MGEQNIPAEAANSAASAELCVEWYLDKRKKDKAFGRFIKSAKKHMKG